MNYLKSMLLVGALLCISISTFAQGPGGRNGQQRGPKGPNVEQMKKALDLTEEQVTALKPIFEDTRTQVEALREKEFASRDARQEAMKAIMDGQKEKVTAILSPEQVVKMEELQEKRQEKGRKGRGGNRNK